MPRDVTDDNNLGISIHPDGKCLNRAITLSPKKFISSVTSFKLLNVGAAPQGRSRSNERLAECYGCFPL